MRLRRLVEEVEQEKEESSLNNELLPPNSEVKVEESPQEYKTDHHQSEAPHLGPAAWYWPVPPVYMQWMGPLLPL